MQLTALIAGLALVTGTLARQWATMPLARPAVDGPRAWLRWSTAGIAGVSSARAHPFLRDGPAVPVCDGVILRGRMGAAAKPDKVVCLLDGGLAAKEALCMPGASPSSFECRCAWAPDEVTAGLHSVAMYASRSVDGLTELVGRAVPMVEVAQSRSLRSIRAALARRPESAARPRAGVYFTTINGPGMSMWQNLTDLHPSRGPAPTVEDAVAAGASFQSLVADVPLTNGSAYFPVNHTDWPQSLPAVGNASVTPFYCFYVPRPGEDPVMPACRDIAYHARRQASLLRAAGVGFILQDASNFGPWDPALPHGGDVIGDVRQMRPFEILTQHWRGLRDGGEATPAVGVFNRVSASLHDGTWRVYLDSFYNNASFSDMVVRAKVNTTGESKKLFMIVNREDVNETAVAEIVANGGRHDVVAPRQWLSHTPNGSDLASGLWAYMSPCTASPTNVSRDGPLVFTGTVWPSGPRCNHHKTERSPVGSVWTSSMAEVFGNVPLINPGKLRGAFFKMQAADALADPEGADFWYSPSWNENSITPVPMHGWAMTNPFFVGAATRKGDRYRYTLWMDGFGAHRSRTIEPMEQDGGLYYGIYASCLRVARLAELLGRPLGDPTLPCSVAGEECCQFSAEEKAHPVWSLRHPGTEDSVLASTQAERDALLSRGYVEMCNPFRLTAMNEATAVCVDDSLPWCRVDVNGTERCFEAVRGPFMLMDGPGAGFSTAVMRCSTAEGRHYPATACLGDDKGDVIGYAWATPSTVAPRRLTRCGPTSAAYHALDHDCMDGSAGALIGFVL